MQYVHGHAACLTSRCPLFGQNQAECCAGETDVQSGVRPTDAPAPEQLAPEQLGRTN